MATNDVMAPNTPQPTMRSAGSSVDTWLLVGHHKRVFYDGHVRRGRLLVVIAGVVLLALGALVAWGVGGALGLSHTPADVPAEQAVAAPATDVTPAPAIAAIDVPPDPRLRLAARAVGDALVQRGQPRPADGPGGLTVRLVAPFAGSPEAYRITGLTVEAGAVAGAANGLYAVADRIRSGAALPTDGGSSRRGWACGSPTPARSGARPTRPRSPPATTTRSTPTSSARRCCRRRRGWTAAAVERIDAQFRQFVDHSLAQGYNGVVVPGFLEYVTFAGVGDGTRLPGRRPARRAGRGDGRGVRAGVPVRRRPGHARLPADRHARRLAAAGGATWSDRRRARRRRPRAVGRSTRPGWPNCSRACRSSDGLMVRIGEGGEVYRRRAGTTRRSSRSRLERRCGRCCARLLETAGARDREIIFRTWTVGVGAVGDLHTNPESYEEVLGGIDDPHLIVSTKYTLGDFYSHLPFNPRSPWAVTAASSSSRRAASSRAFGSLPNDLVGLHAAGAAAVPRREPARRGRLELDAGRRAAARRADDALPADGLLAAVRPQHVRHRAAGVGPGRRRRRRSPRTGCGRRFSDDPATVAAIGEAMALSREAITKGPLHRTVRRQTVQGARTRTAADDVDLRVGHRHRRLGRARQHLRGQPGPARRGDRATATGRWRCPGGCATWSPPRTRRRGGIPPLHRSVHGHARLPGGPVRARSARTGRWSCGTRSGSTPARRRRAAPGARPRCATGSRGTRTCGRYGGDLDLPAYNFTAADLGAQRADRDPADGLAARGCSSLVADRPGCSGRCASAARPPSGPRSRATRRGGWPQSTSRPTRLDRILVVAVPGRGARAQPAASSPGSRHPRTWCSRSAAGCCSRSWRGCSCAVGTRSTCGP